MYVFKHTIDSKHALPHAILRTARHNVLNINHTYVMLFIHICMFSKVFVLYINCICYGFKYAILTSCAPLFLDVHYHMTKSGPNVKIELENTRDLRGWGCADQIGGLWLLVLAGQNFPQHVHVPPCQQQPRVHTRQSQASGESPLFDSESKSTTSEALPPISCRPVKTKLTEPNQV